MSELNEQEIKDNISDTGMAQSVISGSESLENEIDDLKKIIREKRKKMRQINKSDKKRGRKPGSTGSKCTKLRYHVEREIPRIIDGEVDPDNVEVEILGDFSTIQDIADRLGVSYSVAYRAFKRETKLSETVIITKI